MIDPIPLEKVPNEDSFEESEWNKLYDAEWYEDLEVEPDWKAHRMTDDEWTEQETNENS